MNECLTTLQHEKQIGYWVSEKGKYMKWLCVNGVKVQGRVNVLASHGNWVKVQVTDNWVRVQGCINGIKVQGLCKCISITW